MEFMMQILVVSVPVILLGVIGFVAFGHKVKVSIASQLQIREQVELFRDIAVGLMLLGPSAGVLFGIDDHSPPILAYTVASAAFVMFGWFAVQLNKLLVDMRVAQEHQDQRQHAKRAQFLRRRGGHHAKRKKRLKSR